MKSPLLRSNGIVPAAAILLLAALSGTSGSAESAPDSASAVPTVATGGEDAAGIVFERQQVMEQLSKDSEALGAIVAGTGPRDQLGQVTRALADGARDSVQSFHAQVPGGRSKPEVWSNNADFARRMEDFARNAEAMAKAGESGNMAGVTALMIDALPCKQCHDLYREPKKP
ncbi:c-type cytochrome [Novosphingobium sp. ZW T3_23]|uniref:c-type cytochrome n=1 Tax=Novosphingobium sp. ZW T3_23 TaxID=3378084 RepID=UPI003852CBC7